MRWLFSDLDADLVRIRRVVLRRDSGIGLATICDDEELRMYRARPNRRALASSAAP
jgi:hypothetical protein